MALTSRRYRVPMSTTVLHEMPQVTTPVALMTAEELLAYPLPDKRVELVRGRLIVREPPGMRHGEHAARVVVALSSYLIRDRETRSAAQTRGRVVTCDSGFTLARNPDTVRAPDVAYVSRERWEGSCRTGTVSSPPTLPWRSGHRAIAWAPCWPRWATGLTLAHTWCGWSIRRDSRLLPTAPTGRRRCSVLRTFSTAATYSPVSPSQSRSCSRRSRWYGLTWFRFIPIARSLDGHGADQCADRRRTGDQHPANRTSKGRVSMSVE